MTYTGPRALKRIVHDRDPSFEACEERDLEVMSERSGV